VKILVVSDLHYEFRWDHGQEMTEHLAGHQVDAIVVAGDLAVADLLGPALIDLCQHFKHVVYVPGNHEYYGSSFPEVKKILSSLSRSHANLHVLVNKAKVIDGVRFVGTPLWFNYTEKTQADYMLADFRQIEGYREWVGGENFKAAKFLGRSVKHGDVVVTHHAPSMRSTPERYVGSVLNRFFVHPLDEVIVAKKPKLWIHGHTHDSFDYRLAKTRVVCNPYGYWNVDTNSTFKSNLVMEV
jgi:Icc-related predicted phosphoesterase